MRRLVAAVCAAMVVTLSWPASGWAAAPVRDGWWSATNTGLGFSVVPAQVPAGGLYVQNGFGGPVAISALVFDLPAGPPGDELVLHEAGNPVITSPPVACPLDPADLNFKPAQGGPWSDRPSYDCSHVEVKATVNSAAATVSFATARLVQKGMVAVAVLAGGPADQVAFDRPGSDSLERVPAATSPAGPAPQAPPAPSTVGTGTPSAVSVPSATGPAAVHSAAATPGPTGAAASNAGLAAPAISPAAGTPAPSTAALTPAGSAPSEAVAASGRPASAARSSGRTAGSRTAEILGAIGLIGLLAAYTEGYGLLGGRIRPGPFGSRQPSRSRPA